jgi:hypothetical protein
MTPYKAGSWWEREVRDPKILRMHDEGMPIWRIAEEICLSESHIKLILQYYDLTGA